MNVPSIQSDLTTENLSVISHVVRLKEHYDRIFLISHRRHVAQAIAAGPGTLIYATDWLAWRLCVEAGLDAVHFEGLLDTWPAERGDPSQAHRHAWEWVYVDGIDVTLFNGVSLGKLFVRNISWTCHAFSRQWHALDRACKRWRPREIVLLDLRSELDLLDGPTIGNLVQDIAARNGATLLDRRDRPLPGDRGLHDRNDGYGTSLTDLAFKKILRDLFSEALDGICRLRDLVLSPRRTVLLVSNWSTVRGMLDAMSDADSVRPAIVIGHLPKRPAMLWSWIRRGVALVGNPPAFLTRRETAAVDGIRNAIEASWTSRVDGAAAMLRSFVRQNIFDAGWLHAQARETKRWRRLLRRHRPERVVVGDATNSLCRLIAEVAHREGAQVDELLNGMFVTPQRYDARTGDRDYAPPVDRLLAWGPQNGAWLSLTNAPLELAITGYPALDWLRKKYAPSQSRNRALVLPMYVDCDDVLGLWANLFTHLVATVDALARFGCPEIRVKVHPGPFNAAYYADIFDHYGLKVQLIESGSLEPHIEWADFVIGPVNSGAFVESLVCGKTYYPMRCMPSLIDDRLLGPIKCFPDVEAIMATLKSGAIPNGQESGEYLASLSSIPNAGRKTWHVLADSKAESDADAQCSARAMKAAAQ